MAKKKPVKVTMGVLIEADLLINGERQEQYGPPAQFFARLAEHWSLYLTQRLQTSIDITPEDICWMMVDLKKLRQMHSRKSDNIRDAAGYIGLIEKVQDGAL